MVNIMSFGFKHGACAEADLMFDVRFLPNPFYEINLRIKDGRDDQVRDYVFQNGVAEDFMTKLRDMLEFLLPKYIDEGKTSLIIAIGCTGGKHRSVAVSEQTYKYVQKLGYSSVIKHRDIGKV